MVQSIISNKANRLFLILGGFFIANALIAEIIGVKIFSLEDTLGLSPLALRILGNELSFNLTAGVLLWPGVFIMTDLINEYYGSRGVRFLSWLTAGLIAFAFIIFIGAIRLSPAAFFVTGKQGSGVPDMQLAYASVLGQGTTFTVVLPLPLAPSGVIEPARSMVVASRPRRLLLVEDDPIVAEVVAGLLQAEGHAVEVAGQALDALARIQGSAFDLAILDLDLPGVSGLELAGLLRLQAPALPLVALTARADGEAEAEARDAGLVAFLRKPVDGDTLAAVVNAYARED